MQAFISCAEKDRSLARELIGRLSEAGVSVWNPNDAIFPGDNWAKVLGEALEESDLMIVLLTPGAMGSSTSLQHEISYALTSLNYQHRVLTLLVGPAFEMRDELPWVLARLPHQKVESLDQGVSWLLGEVRMLV